MFGCEKCFRTLRFKEYYKVFSNMLGYKKSFCHDSRLLLVIHCSLLKFTVAYGGGNFNSMTSHICNTRICNIELDFAIGIR